MALAEEPALGTAAPEEPAAQAQLAPAKAVPAVEQAGSPLWATAVQAAELAARPSASSLTWPDVHPSHAAGLALPSASQAPQTALAKLAWKLEQSLESQVELPAMARAAQAAQKVQMAQRLALPVRPIVLRELHHWAPRQGPVWPVSMR